MWRREREEYPSVLVEKMTIPGHFINLRSPKTGYGECGWFRMSSLPSCNGTKLVERT